MPYRVAVAVKGFKEIDFLSAADYKKYLFLELESFSTSFF